MLFDFSAEWCVSCKEMEKYTFLDVGVIAALEKSGIAQGEVFQVANLEWEWQ